MATANRQLYKRGWSEQVIQNSQVVATGGMDYCQFGAYMYIHESEPIMCTKANREPFRLERNARTNVYNQHLNAPACIHGEHKAFNTRGKNHSLE